MQTWSKERCKKRHRSNRHEQFRVASWRCTQDFLLLLLKWGETLHGFVLWLFKGFLQSQRPNFNLIMKPEEEKSAWGEEKKKGGGGESSVKEYIFSLFQPLSPPYFTPSCCPPSVSAPVICNNSKKKKKNKQPPYVSKLETSAFLTAEQAFSQFLYEFTWATQ